MGFIEAIKKVLRTQIGFSLTEVTIGAAVLTGVALTSSKLFKNERTAQRSTELDQKLSFYHQTLTKTLQTADNCNATFKKLYNEIPSPVNPVPIQTIYTCQSQCTANAQGMLYYDAFIPGSYVGTPLISVEDYIDKTITWKVCEMNIVEGRLTSGLIKLRISYCMNPKLKNYKVSKDVFINVRIEGGNFRGCIDGKENAVTNLQSDLCKSLLGASVSTGGELATWDPVTQSCQVSKTFSCPSGQMVDGIGADGKPKCKNTVYNTDAKDLSDSTPQSCNAPQKPKITYVSGKVRIICQ